MVKRLMYSKILLGLCEKIFCLFYNKKYLNGKYFYEKRMGWVWAFKSLPRRLWGKDRGIPWPIGKNTLISNSYNIEFHNSSMNVFQMPGCYFQCHKGKIKIGKELHLAPNCGIITTNHDIYNPNKHVNGRDVVIGDNCWIGMNSVILPGVKLGNHTVVGAGSVVTKSFSEGYVVIAGNPAKEIYKIDKSKIDEDMEKKYV